MIITKEEKVRLPEKLYKFFNSSEANSVEIDYWVEDVIANLNKNYPKGIVLLSHFYQPGDSLSFYAVFNIINYLED
jgi:hypothetical protein